MKIDYKNGRKNQWRRTLWNSIVDRLEVPPRDAVVVYLPGPQDLDRAVAKSKGFREENLIPVERDPKFVKMIRKKGVSCVHGDLINAVAFMALNHRVDVVLGDFMCGLELSIINKILLLMTMKNLSGSVFAFNFLRGRDASSNKIRHRVAGLLEPLKTVVRNLNTNHRGRIFFTRCQYIAIEAALRDLNFPTHDLKTAIELQEKIDNYTGSDDFELASYKSKNQSFDSVVMMNAFGKLFFEIQDRDAGGVNREFPFDPCNKTKLSVAAFLAHRTTKYGNQI